MGYATIFDSVDEFKVNFPYACLVSGFLVSKFKPYDLNRIRT